MKKNHDENLGKKFNMLTILDYKTVKKNGKSNTYYLCQCECGRQKWIRCGRVIGSITKSCGCLVDNGHDKNLIGKKFGRLLVLEEAPKKGEDRAWLCKCDCGNVTVIRGTALWRGTVSCGCYAKERVREVHTKHNDSYSRIFHIFESMKSRCLNPKEQHYSNYGGRGIKVCTEWLDKDCGFVRFRDWAYKNGYSDKLTLDRINVNGNYEPQNCRWVTVKQQNNNTRRNLYIEYKGERKTVAEWSELTGIPYGTLAGRVRKGFSVERIFCTEYKRQRCSN